MSSAPLARLTRPTLVLSLFWCAMAGSAAAQSSDDGPLVVAVKEAPPFAVRNTDGTWSGISVELWRDIAVGLGREFTFEETDLPGLLAGVESGAVDVGVGAITVTPDREVVMDFSHPFHVSGLGIAVRQEQRRGWVAVLEQLFSFQFFRVVMGLTALLFVVGWLVWLFERRANPDQFGGTRASGLGSGFWWSAVTMTTVGYGDKAPQTTGGRVVALLWMFTALIVISSFTASITASLTVGSLEGAVSGVDDLPDVRVASVTASTSAEYLDGEGLFFRQVTTPDEALDLLSAGEVDAVVYDAPMLRYEVRRRFAGSLAVLPATFERQLYALALPTGSVLAEEINRLLLERTESSTWSGTLNAYLGEAR